VNARVNGIQLDYDATGTGTPVLLTHGFGSTRQSWEGQHRALADRYRIISWDVRGHGETISPDDAAGYSIDLSVADMRALLELLGVEQAVIGGLSLGGYLSLAFYHAHPEMVRALVVVSSGPGYRNPDARARWNERAQRRAADLDSQGLEALDGGSPDMLRSRRRHRSAHRLAHAARGILAQEDARVIDMLPDIKVPTLVVLGDQDEPFAAPSHYMAAKIPGARLEVIEGAGHAANLDRPEAFNRVLRAFLDALPRSG
jgi:pimeloyl-ACP methyl ester carboxylesterase